MTEKAWPVARSHGNEHETRRWKREGRREMERPYAGRLGTLS